MWVVAHQRYLTCLNYAQAPSHSLLPAAGPIISTLLSVDLETSDPTPTRVLLRRITTALSHHTAKAEQFSAVSDVLVHKLTKDFEEATTADKASLDHKAAWIALARTMDLVGFVWSVRKGARITREERFFASVTLTDIVFFFTRGTAASNTRDVFVLSASNPG